MAAEMTIRNQADLTAMLPASADPIYARIDAIDSLVGAVAFAHADASGDIACTANGAAYYRFTVLRRVKVNRFVVRIGVTSGNIDVGIYSPDGTGGIAGTKLVSSGSTAASGSGTRQSITIAETTLAVGVYWAGIAADNATLTLAGNSRAGAFLFAHSQATAFPLPSSATPVAGTGGGAFCFSLERA